MNIEKDLLYTEEHEWVRVEGNCAYVGIDDYAQEHLGDVVYVELPEGEEELEKGETFASVESVKAASDIYMPLSGKIVEVNDVLDSDPGLLNADPYENWIIKIEMTNPDEVDDLMSHFEYTAFLEEE